MSVNVTQSKYYQQQNKDKSIYNSGSHDIL